MLNNYYLSYYIEYILNNYNRYLYSIVDIINVYNMTRAYNFTILYKQINTTHEKGNF